MDSRYFRWLTGTGLGLCLVLSACGKKSSSTTANGETSILLTGQLAVTGGSTSLALASTVSVDDLNVYCVSFTLPPVAGTGDVGQDGAFSVSIATTGVSVGCFILDSSQSVLGTLVFKDPSKNSVGGSSSTSDRLALDGGESNLGAITLDLDSGKAEVDISKITVKKKDTSSAVANAFDFTGTYKFSKADSLPGKGYASPCTMQEAQAARQTPGPNACEGPMLDMPIYLKRVTGKSTTDGSTLYALAAWQSQGMDTTCGNKLGFTYEQGKAHGVDFSASGVGEGSMSWASGYADGWKNTASATASFPYMDMEQVDNFHGYPGMKQYFTQYIAWNCTNTGCQPGTTPTTGVTGFMFNANTKDSGCRDSDGKPVQNFNDWRSLTCKQEDAGEGLRKNTCSGTYNSKAITCTNVGGAFLVSGGTESTLQNAMVRFSPDDPSKNDFSILLAKSALCSSANTSTERGKLAQLRCYADYNQQNMHGPQSAAANACVRDVQVNWAAKTAAEFIIGGDGPQKPLGQHIFDRFEFDSDTSGSVRSERASVRGVQAGDNFTDCPVTEVFAMSIKKIDGSSDLYGEIQMTTKSTSAKPACKSLDGGSKKLAFKLLKQ